eukprot:TRINITY_DN123394_c0_g1_i1.p1 TRINITY_DN123394_c0_g1~~TRINITY_DN123394_c0_g1_i1.p1  ORF type:complete len:192 (-),score=39.41 TRINITY_DN123394_c0_g1_i1:289-864(-)
MVSARGVTLTVGLAVGAAQDVFLAAKPEAEASVEAAPSGFTAYLATHQGNLCLSVANDQIGQGAKVQAETCVEGSGQQFVYLCHDSTLRAANDPEFCVVTQQNEMQLGAKAELRKCDEAGASKHWIANKLELYKNHTAFVPVGNEKACLGMDHERWMVLPGEEAMLADASVFVDPFTVDPKYHCFVTAAQL